MLKKINDFVHKLPLVMLAIIQADRTNSIYNVLGPIDLE